MKTGRYASIAKAFRRYEGNKRALANYPFPYVRGVDYTKPRITPDRTQNGAEQMILSVIDEKSDLERLVRLVDETLKWFELEGYGRERYIKLRMINGMSEFAACDRIGISERTGRRWKRDIFEKAELIGECIGVFKEKK